jgi:adenylate kinase
MNVCLLGMTGAGKTTIARSLSERLHVPRVSSGDLARALAQEDPHTAVALDKGRMAPEAAMRHEVRRALEAADLAKGGWILEGFPRDMAQLVCLMDWTAALPCFVHVDVTEWSVIERLTSRRRDDDTPDAIAARIADFHRLAVPVLSALEGGGVLYTTERYWSLEETVENIERWVCRP